MTAITCLLIGYLAGAVSMFPGGKTYARALRAYRDWRATVQGVRGLRRRTFSMWAKAVRQLGAVVLVVVVLAVVVYGLASR